jgi:hypothetical protein
MLGASSKADSHRVTSCSAAGCIAKAFFPIFVTTGWRCAGQNKNVISFGDDEESNDEDVLGSKASIQFRSAHEMIKDDRRLESVPEGVHDAHVAELKARLAAEQVRIQSKFAGTKISSDGSASSSFQF